MNDINENICSIVKKKKIIVPMKKLFLSHFCSHLKVDYPLKRVFTLTACVVYLNADCDSKQCGDNIHIKKINCEICLSRQLDRVLCPLLLF